MTKLTLEEISLLVEICKSTTTRVDQAIPIIQIINKLAEMGKETQVPSAPSLEQAGLPAKTKKS